MKQITLKKMTSTLKLSKPYWVIHTDKITHKTIHVKQVMHEVWRDGKIVEEPLSERFMLSQVEFDKAIDAYNWNEVLGEPSNYIKKN